MFLRKLVPAKSYKCSRLATLFNSALYVYKIFSDIHKWGVKRLSAAGNKKYVKFKILISLSILNCSAAFRRTFSVHVLGHSLLDCLSLVMAV